MSGRLCSVDGCDRPARARGWCHTHYSRWYRHGDPMATARNWVPWLDNPTPEGHTFDPSDDRHGTMNGYQNLGCRCGPCTAAWRVWHREWMHADPERLSAHAERERQRRLTQRRTGAA